MRHRETWCRGDASLQHLQRNYEGRMDGAKYRANLEDLLYRKGHLIPACVGWFITAV